MKRQTGMLRVVCAALALCIALAARAQQVPTPEARDAAEHTPGYSELVLQWTVEPGETCQQIATAMYGSARFLWLLQRYNAVDCTRQLTPGRILILPSEVNTPPPATLNASQPTVRSRTSSSDWQEAKDGMALNRGDSVNTLEQASADIVFRDRSRIFLGEQTLVVIYGTAEDSAFGKTPTARVQLDEGELRAGIAALTGGSWSMATEEGATVEAESENLVVRRSEAATSVSVFDGRARVRSAGTTVGVPQAHGTRFKRNTPPEPPRPLPEAPEWAGDALPAASLVDSTGGTLRVSWNALPRAVAYRVELAFDPSFTRLALRQEVPAQITAFRAERLPVGRYFVRVQAVDDYDLLGLPSAVQSTRFVSVAVTGGQFRDGKFSLSAYGWIDLTGPASARVRIDDSSELLELPLRLDMLQRPIRELHVTGPGDTATSYPVSVEAPRASALLTWASSSSVAARVTGSGLDDPRASVVFEFAQMGKTVARLTPTAAQGALSAVQVVQPGLPVELRVLDVRGDQLARVTLPVAQGEFPAQVGIEAPRLGVSVPFVSSTADASISWWAPNAASTVVLTLSGASNDRGAQAALIANAEYGPVGFGVRAASDTLGTDAAADDALTLHAVTGDALSNKSAFGIRSAVLLGPDRRSPPVRVEIGAAWGWASQRFTTLGNVNLRVATSPFEGDPDADSSASSAFHQTGSTIRPSLVWGATLDWGQGHWSQGRSYLSLDVHWLSANEQLRAAATAGIEFGTTWLLGLGLRGTPWADFGGHGAAMAAFGLRAD